MTLLIADDEELVRFTIRDMLKECSLEFSRVIEAESGPRFISLCREYKPDIALVDIRMPGKSGLEAIEELHDQETCWIILTGHADFEYARKALKLGADDYLLKPPSPEELKNLLLKTREKVREKKKDRQLDFERRLTSLFNNTSAPGYDPLFSEEGIWSGWIVNLDSGLPEREALEEQTRISMHIRNNYIPFLPDGYRGALTTTESGELLITLLYQPVFPPNHPEPLPAAPEKEEEKAGVLLRFFPVEKAETFQNYLQNLGTAIRDLPLRFLQLDGLPFKEENRRYLPYCVKLDELILLAGTSRKEELDEAAKELLQMESSFSPAEEEFLCRILRKIIPDLPEKKGFRKTLAAYLEKSGKEGQDKQSVLVQQALRIIREEYHQEIGIAQIAYKLQVTPNYLSSLFRKHAGLPFTRYITEIRMNKARRLLKETSLNIKEIASEVGYQSSRHFSGLFRQETGLTPTEYIRKYRA